MVLYDALPKKEYERIFMCKTAKDIWQSLLITYQGNSQVKDKKIDLLVQQYEQFTILEEESIDSTFARFNFIITSLKALDEGFFNKNYVRKFLRALHPKWRAKVTVIEELKDLSSLALDELIGNLKVHEVLMEKDSEIYRGKKERVKSIALKVKKESSDNETLTFGSDEEEYSMALRNFTKFFRRKGKFVRQPREEKKSFQQRGEKKGNSNRKCFRCDDPNNLIGDCPKPTRNKDQKAFIRDVKEFGLEDSKPTKTPMSTKIKLTKDDEADSMDSFKYQENPKTTHLEAVKRIFRYIRGTTYLGLWYPKGTGIETIVYVDSDHAGDYVDHKSTRGVCTFMGCCLTFWFAIKQTALVISTTEAEYVSAGKACQQALWMKQALIDYDICRDDQTYPPTTAEEKLARKHELLAIGTLLMALLNEHKLKFNSYKNARSLMEAIKKRFGGNKESKKVQKTLLKQYYENFNKNSLEGLNQIYDRLQKLISELEIHRDTISQEDLNLKLLRSLPSEWKTHTLIWRNKPDLKTLSMNDLYNNLKIYKTVVKGSSSSRRNSQNAAFVSSNSTGSTNQAHGSNSASIDSLSDAVADGYVNHESQKIPKKSRRKIGANGFETIVFDKIKVECYNCHKRGHFVKECRAPKENRNREPFWATATAKNINGEAQIHAKVDGKKVIISEAIIKIDLKFEDEEGVDCLSNEVIFEQLPLMGYENLSQKLTFYKAFFSLQWNTVKHLDSGTKFLMYLRFVQVFLDKQVDGMSKHNAIYVIPTYTKKVFSNIKRVGKDFSGRDTPLFLTMIVQPQEELGEYTKISTDTQHTPTIIQPTTYQPQRKQKPRKTRRNDTELPQTSVPTEVVADKAVYEEMHDSVERAATTSTGLDAEQERGIISKTQLTATLNEPSFIGTSSGSGPKRQKTIGDAAAQTRSERVSKFSNDPPLSRVNTLRSGEDRLQLKELMKLCTKLSDRVLDLEKTKTAQAKEIANLKKRVKRLERKKSQDLIEESSKQGMIEDIDADDNITLVNNQEMFKADRDLQGEKVVARQEKEVLFKETQYVQSVVEKVIEDITTTDIEETVSTAAIITTDVTPDELTMAQALVEIKKSKPKGATTTTTTNAITITTPNSTRPKARGIVMQERIEATTTTILILTQVKDKGKGKMIEPEMSLKKKAQISLDKELAFKLQAEQEEEERIAREKALEANITE
nr:zf-CCHC domain-containing protein/UBN2 domain-containing protein [Tanacetum cinerariifolium]